MRTNGSTIHVDPDGEVTLEPGDRNYAGGDRPATLADASLPKPQGSGRL